jgi:hypothetical protein
MPRAGVAAPQAEVNDFICVKYAPISQHSLNMHNKFNRQFVRQLGLVLHPP